MGTSEPIRAVVRRTEFLYSAPVEPPAFDLPAQWAEFHRALYVRLLEYGVRLQDLRQEPGLAVNPADFSIICGLSEHGARLRFRLDRIEVWSQRPEILRRQSAIAAIAAASVDALAAATGTTAVESHVVTVGLHASLVDRSVVEWLSAHSARIPAGHPELTLGGVSFVCDVPSERMRASVVLQQSGEIEGAIHVRTISEYSGERPCAESVEAGIGFALDSLRRVGLDLAWSAP